MYTCGFDLISQRFSGDTKNIVYRQIDRQKDRQIDRFIMINTGWYGLVVFISD